MMKQQDNDYFINVRADQTAAIRFEDESSWTNGRGENDGGKSSEGKATTEYNNKGEAKMVGSG